MTFSTMLITIFR